ncbi:VanZ like family protein [Streptococcus oralis]|nr:VanZ like family protein [Streptococcus oralis]
MHCLFLFYSPASTSYRSGNSRYSNFWTPGFSLTPLNSLWNLGEVTSLGQVIWIFLQNILNVFLLFPLVFQLIYLCPNLRQTKKIILLSFLLSLGIECTQLVLDFLFDFNRVFEIDDLWTNTLGGYLAWLLYKGLHKNKIRN